MRTIFSDESTVQSQPNAGRLWVFRKPYKKFLAPMVNLKVHRKSPISLIVWAAVWRDGQSELIFMERDPNAPRQGYSA
ncbi:hypothetical protein S40285_03673 [Stachybotrys chlorohalonatus IBT 40285]|uniref:Uncharacterized protein n=1 Tax=Stachybotrys chlorohalonatus (strain IBT 40285) TaxID=1283841 RepID=A0A084QQ29_STAC4|nr:hypothetical protein S40285_03673 [Stachybotrys chlorohalonata IBT 40285]